MNRWLACGVMATMAVAAAWPKSTAVVGAAQALPQANAPVQMVAAGTQVAASPGEKGATYYGLEAQTVRLTTKFRDGHIAVSQRRRLGGITTTLSNAAGADVGKLTVSGIDAAHDLVHYEPTDGPGFQAVSNPAVIKPTLDWTSTQAYHFKHAGVGDLVWDKTIMRPKTKAKIDVEAEISEVHTEWAEGLSATMTRQNYDRRQLTKGRSVGGPAMVSDLKQFGIHVGVAIWFEKDRAFAYYIPALMPKGMDVIYESDLMAAYGTGWPFTPDSAWINLQVIATHHLKTLAAKNGSTNVARNCTDRSVSSNRMARLAQFFVPTVLANDAGCDGLHRLDGGVVRECCDDHDLCYVSNGCDSDTWWQWWRSWSCDKCNLAAVRCFLVTGGTIDPGCIRARNPLCAG